MRASKEYDNIKNQHQKTLFVENSPGS